VAQFEGLIHEGRVCQCESVSSRESIAREVEADSLPSCFFSFSFSFFLFFSGAGDRMPSCLIQPGASPWDDAAHI